MLKSTLVVMGILIAVLACQKPGPDTEAGTSEIAEPTSADGAQSGCSERNPCPSGGFCVDGDCSAGLLGDKCSDTCAGGHECAARQCISNTVGGDCTDKCAGALYCHDSKCLAGSEGDGCNSEGSCNEGLLCEGGACLRLTKAAACTTRCAPGFYCDGGSCQDGAAGDSCGSPDQCKEGLYCAQKKCWAGESGDTCTDSCGEGLHCVKKVCHDGNLGSACKVEDHCNEKLLCAVGECRAGDKGDPCDDKCKLGNYCLQGKCWDGAVGDTCNIAHACQEDLYCAAGQCYAGGAGDKCNETCKAGLHCVAGVCHDGTIGASCETAEQCEEGIGCRSGKCNCPEKGGGFKCAVKRFDDLAQRSKPYTALETNSGKPPWFMEKPQSYCGESYGTPEGTDEFDVREKARNRDQLKRAITTETYHSWGLGQTSNQRELGTRDFNLLIERYDFKKDLFEFRICPSSTRRSTLTGKAHVEKDGPYLDFGVAANPNYEQLWGGAYFKPCFKDKLRLPPDVAKQISRDPSKCRVDVILDVKGVYRHKQCGTDCIFMLGCVKVDQGAGPMWDLRVKTWKISLGEQVLAVKGAQRSATR